MITTFQGVEEQKVLANPSTDGVYILLQSMCNPLESEQSGIELCHWHKHYNLFVGDYTGDVVNVNEEQEGT